MISLLFLCILCAVRSAVSLPPTQAEICADPVFDGGIAISDPINSLIIKRYLFRGQYVMPYLWDRQQIDWQKIESINNMFRNGPQKIDGIRYGFTAQNQVYLSFKKDETNIYVFEQNGDKFDRNETLQWSSLGFEFLKWNISTKLPKNTSTTKTMYFVDSTPVRGGSPSQTEMPFKYTEGTIKMSVNKLMSDESVRNYPSIFPNTLIYQNLAKKQIKIPIEFDGYYQTMKEVVFFKGSAACVQTDKAQTPHETKYCHSFVDTRTLIGCFIATEKTSTDSGAEIFSEEPEDIDPNF